jgi:hypothetical protein
MDKLPKDLIHLLFSLGAHELARCSKYYASLWNIYVARDPILSNRALSFCGKNRQFSSARILIPMLSPASMLSTIHAREKIFANACMINARGMINLLIHHGHVPTHESLELAIEHGHVDIARKLFDMGIVPHGNCGACPNIAPLMLERMPWDHNITISFISRQPHLVTPSNDKKLSGIVVYKVIYNGINSCIPMNDFYYKYHHLMSDQEHIDILQYCKHICNKLTFNEWNGLWKHLTLLLRQISSDLNQ